MSNPQAKFVGMQISPISFIDEGVEEVLEVLQRRVGINVLLVGTVSWLGLKVGRRISWELEGFPDHGVQAPMTLRGGSFLQRRPDFYRNTFIQDFRAQDPEFGEGDVLDMVLPEARKRGLRVMPELMEPLFKYSGHGSAAEVSIPGLAQCLEVDHTGRFGAEPCLNHPAYRTWWHSILEDHARNYAIDGIMWCNERQSPLDKMVAGEAPACFCPHCLRLAQERGLDADATRRAYAEVYAYFQAARAGEEFVDGAFIEFLRVLFAHPEILLYERLWVERNQGLDKELYGLVKWCNPELEFGLNVWNRNHFNPFRKAQWPWRDQTAYADWVKPITYAHQSGQIYCKEMTHFHQSILRDVTPEEMTPVMYKFLNLDEAPWPELIRKGLDPDTYVFGQCRDTVKAVGGRVPVYMGLGVDAPRVAPQQAACTPEHVYRCVKATYRAGGRGVIFSPNYAGMNLSNLDGAARALEELGLK